MSASTSKECSKLREDTCLSQVKTDNLKRRTNLFLTDKLQSSATIVAEDCSFSVRNKLAQRIGISF